MKRLFIFSFALLSAAGASHAATPIYGSITEKNQDSFVLRYKTLESANYHLCGTSTLACRYYGTTTPTLPIIATTTPSKPAEEGLRATSRSGRFVATYKAATSKDPKRVFSVSDTTTGKIYTIESRLAYWDLLSEEYKLFAFNPSETKLVYLDDKDGHPSLYAIDLTKLSDPVKSERLMTRPYSVSDFLFVDDNRLLFTANREHPLRWALHAYDFSAETATKISDANYGTPLKRIGSYVSFSRTKNNISEIAFYDPVLKTVKTPSFDRNAPIATVEPVQEPITLAGLNAVVLKPDNFSAAKAYPLLLWLHGGPYRQTSIGYHPYGSYGVYDQTLESFRQRGYLVVKLDYHGSYGYGRPFAESLQYNVGKIDVKDVTDAVTALKNRYTISKIYPIGNSYGGYLALKAAADKPALFAGAISIAGVTDWQFLIEKLPDTIFKTHFNSPTGSMNALLEQASIVKNAKALSAKKVLLIHGQMDNSVPVDQADFLYRALPGNNVEFIAIPEEDHVLTKQSSLELVCRSIETFLGLPKAPSCLR
ncbi:MAG TPA: alpha/beta fold hydrolase, partial [Candidatus Paceibacterota bacterium]|nr:alpha/beta fold hydrolase [Candidatus Paceibacterota bacterium]